MRTRPKRGFTLAEVLISVVLLALGFIALMAAFGNESVVAQRGEDVMTATYLADEVRDMALGLSFSEVLALDDTTFDPAVLSTGAAQGSARWSQQVWVDPVLVDDLTVIDPSESPAAARVTVAVLCNGDRVMTQVYHLFEMTGVPFVSEDQAETDDEHDDEEDDWLDDEEEDEEDEDDDERWGWW